jgi:hypothetical protein
MGAMNNTADWLPHQDSAKPGAHAGSGNSGASRIRRIEDVPPLSAFDFTEITFVAEPALPEGAIVAFSGDSGAGKSTLTLWFAREAVKTGRPVLILDRENHIRIVRERVNRLRVEESPLLTIWGGWILDDEPPHPGSPIVQEWVRRCDPRPLIVVDSFTAFLRGNENDSQVVREFFASLRPLANLGACLVVLHNDGKSETARDYRGSSDFKASLDQAFHVSNSAGDEGRLGTLRLRPYKSRIGQAGELVYRYHDGTFLYDETPGATSRSNTDELMWILRKHPGVNARELDKLAQDARISRDRARQILRDGLRAGTIREIVGPGRTRRYYLADESPGDGGLEFDR